MFCPKCGCMLPDGASVCRECGCRIRKNDRSSLGEKQPVGTGTYGDRSPRAVRHWISIAAGTVASLVMITSIFMEWLNPGMTGFGIVADGYPSGGIAVLRAVPAIVAAVGALSAVRFVSAARLASAVFPLGMACAALAVILCASGWGYGYSAGTGTYVAVLSSCITAMIGLRTTNL